MLTSECAQPVISEFYDELVFTEPTEFFYKKLMAGRSHLAAELMLVMYSLGS